MPRKKPGPRRGPSIGTLDGNVLTVQHVTSRGEKRLDHRRITITLPAWWPQEAQVCVRWVRGRDPECWVSPVVEESTGRKQTQERHE